jgi:CP family cyanate transporter-like MFS transporter
VLGVAIGPLFPLTMTLPLDATDRPAEVASLAGMMLGVGYTLSATAPLLLGVIRDATGGFTAVLWTLVGLAALLVVVDTTFSPERLRAQGST